MKSQNTQGITTTIRAMEVTVGLHTTTSSFPLILHLIQLTLADANTRKMA